MIATHTYRWREDDANSFERLQSISTLPIAGEVIGEIFNISRG